MKIYHLATLAYIGNGGKPSGNREGQSMQNNFFLKSERKREKMFVLTGSRV
jgi:hypothetical protein